MKRLCAQQASQGRISADEVLQLGMCCHQQKNRQLSWSNVVSPQNSSGSRRNTWMSVESVLQCVMSRLIFEEQCWPPLRRCAACTSSLDPISLVRASPAYESLDGTKTIPLQITLERSKSDGLLTGLLPTPSKWGTRNDWSTAKRLAYLGRSLSRHMEWGQKVGVFFPRLNSNHNIEDLRRSWDEVPFTSDCRNALRNLPGSRDLFSALKGTISGVSGRFRFGSSRGATWLVAGRYFFSMELSVELELLE